VNNEQLVQHLVEQLETEGFQPDEEEKSYTLIDYRGTHRIVTYFRECMWVTFTLTVEDDDGPTDFFGIPFEEMLKENGSGTTSHV
jgi:hypothetical protein